MKLFVIEGVDGSGKSTQLKLLKDFIIQKGFDCEFLHFPRTDAPFFGELIARFLRGEFGSLRDVDPYLVAMLYAGDRKDAAALISGWLNKKKIVLLTGIRIQILRTSAPKSKNPFYRITD